MSIYDDADWIMEKSKVISDQLDRAIDHLSSIDDDSDREEVYHYIEKAVEILEHISSDIY